MTHFFKFLAVCAGIIVTITLLTTYRGGPLPLTPYYLTLLIVSNSFGALSILTNKVGKTGHLVQHCIEIAFYATFLIVEYVLLVPAWIVWPLLVLRVFAMVIIALAGVALVVKSAEKS